MWSGDPEATFDDTQGLPAMLRGGLNLALSGVPYWGSDVGGFKCLTDALRDKEVLVRWYAVGALSPIMMDQDACVNPAEKRTKILSGNVAKLYGLELSELAQVAHLDSVAAG